MQDSYSRVVEYYGENARNISPANFFAQIVRFVNSFKVGKPLMSLSVVKIKVVWDIGWGWNSSVGSVLSSLFCVMQRCGFDSPLRRIFLVEWIFPLEVTWVLTPFPKNSLG